MNVSIYVTNSRLSLRSSVENFFTATSVVLYVLSVFLSSGYQAVGT